MAIEKEIDLNDFYKVDLSRKYVFGEGVYLYSGPSFAYSKVSEEEIPIGTILEYEYRDNDRVWIYTSYDGVFGWVYVNSSNNNYLKKTNVASYTIDAQDVLTIEDITSIKSLPFDDADDVEIYIPDGEILTYNYYYYQSPYSSYVYINYNGISGWLLAGFVESAKFPDENYLVTLEETKIYTDCFGNNEVNMTIPKNIFFKSDYYYSISEYNEDTSEWINTTSYRVSYNDEAYWIVRKSYYNINTDTDTSLNDTYKILGKGQTYNLNYEFTIYDNPNDLNDIGILNDKEVTVYGSYYGISGTMYYVTSNSISGWITKNDYLLLTDNSEEANTEEIIEEEKVVEESPIEKPSIRFNLIFYIVGSIILGITALVTIILINKKKNIKN